jgi:hypothetical protein
MCLHMLFGKLHIDVSTIRVLGTSVACSIIFFLPCVFVGFKIPKFYQVLYIRQG